MLVWIKLITVWIPFIYGVIKDIAPWLYRKYKTWKKPTKDDKDD